MKAALFNSMADITRVSNEHAGGIYCDSMMHGAHSRLKHTTFFFLNPLLPFVSSSLREGKKKTCTQKILRDQEVQEEVRNTPAVEKGKLNQKHLGPLTSLAA